MYSQAIGEETQAKPGGSRRQPSFCSASPEGHTDHTLSSATKHSGLCVMFLFRKAHQRLSAEGL